jgi:hypothetical protein
MLRRVAHLVDLVSDMSMGAGMAGKKWCFEMYI